MSTIRMTSTTMSSTKATNTQEGEHHHGNNRDHVHNQDDKHHTHNPDDEN